MDEAGERSELGNGGPEAGALARPRARLLGAAAEQPEVPGLASDLDGPARELLGTPETHGRHAERRGGEAPRVAVRRSSPSTDIQFAGGRPPPL